MYYWVLVLIMYSGTDMSTFVLSEFKTKADCVTAAKSIKPIIKRPLSKDELAVLSCVSLEEKVKL